MKVSKLMHFLKPISALKPRHLGTLSRSSGNLVWSCRTRDYCPWFSDFVLLHRFSGILRLPSKSVYECLYGRPSLIESVLSTHTGESSRLLLITKGGICPVHSVATALTLAIHGMRRLTHLQTNHDLRISCCELTLTASWWTEYTALPTSRVICDEILDSLTRNRRN